jgi:hypothetical protein
LTAAAPAWTLGGEETVMNRDSRQGASSLLILVLVLVVVLFGLALTNPTREEHERALRARLTEISRDQPRRSGLLGAVAAAAMNEMAVEVLMADVEYQNYVLFSRTTLNGSAVTFGIARNVVVKD